ncbi:MAG TPA: tetratricopeptide repeat protein [Polyangiales bacterium]|nr:tetratricopeptide repeat protein [Polyangiales bacterium]
MKQWVCSLVVQLVAASVLLPSAHAELPPLLRSENGNVRDGNEKLNRGDAKGALESYTLAARQLPEAPGVQLDRGLALLKSGDLAKARESFLSATTPSAPPPLRADAYENLALAFYREGDQLAGQNKHKEAQQMFRESLDAGKRSLRLRPGDPNTAWNLELAARRIREEEQKQKQKEEEEKQKQDEKDKDKDKDKDKQQDDQSKDQQQNQDQKDQQQSGDDKKQDQDKPKGDQDQKKQDQQPKQDPPKDQQQQQQQPQQGQDGQDQPEQAEEKQLPAEAEQALDALGNSEENFERYRARQRASRERRAPEKDW